VSGRPSRAGAVVIVAPGAPPDLARWIRPRLFTRDAWAALDDEQRALVLDRRRAAVDALQADHLFRFHHTGRLAVLYAAVYGPGHDPA
jgi:hypothetical protein